MGKMVDRWKEYEKEKRALFSEVLGNMSEDARAVFVQTLQLEKDYRYLSDTPARDAVLPQLQKFVDQKIKA